MLVTPSWLLWWWTTETRHSVVLPWAMPISFDTACYCIEGEMTGRAPLSFWIGKVSKQSLAWKGHYAGYFGADNTRLLCQDAHSPGGAALLSLSMSWCPQIHWYGMLGWLDEMFIIRRNLAWVICCPWSCPVLHRGWHLGMLWAVWKLDWRSLDHLL